MSEELSCTLRAVAGVVIVPARNESGSVGGVVQEIRKHVGWEVIVIDDASNDDTTIEARRSGAQVVRLPFRLGAWGALQAGMRYALRKGYRVAVTMDADGQHSAKDVYTVALPVIQRISDVAIGIAPERLSGSRSLACRVFSSITGLKLQDLTSGFRAYSSAAMQVLVSPGAALLNYQDVGVLLMVREAGMRATEVSVSMQKRTNGRSRVYESQFMVARYLMETMILSAGKWRPSWHFDEMIVRANSVNEVS
ncbi:MAG: glycosyltransferase family 2 protein [Nitrosospira sp.]|nr:glycosyltransferase family 2 protein [Nitrosospira sp.]